MLTSMLRLPRMDVLIPESETEAVRMILRERDAAPIAGGTDLIPRIRSREIRPRKLIDLLGLRKLQYITPGKRFIKVGALTRLSDLLANPHVLKHPAFKTMYEKQSSLNVMNLATVGGALWLRSQRSDLAVIMLAMNGRIKLRGRRGVKIMTYEKFLAAKAVKGLLTETQIPVAAENTLTLFDKIRFSTSKIPLMSISIHLRLGKENVIREARVVAGYAKGENMGRVTAAERTLKGRKLDRERIEKAAEKLEKTIKPLSDFMAPDWYRKRAAANLFKRMLFNLLEGGEPT